MIIFWGTAVFILGAMIGSFLNVVILRHNTGLSVMKNMRSQCFSCGKKISWYENIPLLSFVFLRGKCSGCRTKISWQYPLVELGTGVLFLGLFLKLQPLSSVLHVGIFMFYAIILSLLTVIFVYDLYHKIIPNTFVYPFILLSFFTSFLLLPLGQWGETEHLLHLSAGPLLFLPFFFLWFLSKGRWMGFADGKLALGIGWLLGLSAGLSAIVLGFWIGAAISIVLLVKEYLTFRRAVGKSSLHKASRRFTMKSEVPFAPFLIAGTVLAFFFQWDVLNLQALIGSLSL